jgi:predicted AlkP superfamily phosphohydrolase/phosphomutase
MSDRALVIGLDGMPRTLLDHLIREGVTPNLASLVGPAGCAELVAPVPEISSTSWASFLTGVNPGRHGVYGFVDLVPGGYETYYPNVSHLRARPFWSYAGEHGLDTVCLNVPGTYPAPAIRGVLVSGFVAPVLERAVRPQRLVGPLRQLRYELDVEVGDVAGDPVGFHGRLRRSLAARTAAFRHVLGTEPWDLAVAVFTETDRFQHFLWRTVVEPDDPLHPMALDFYRQIDTAVGAVVEAAGGRTPFLVSDHGFGRADRQFYLNQWLREGGWLSPLAEVGTLAAMDRASRAFALDPGRVYLHRASRFPRGCLTDRAADELAAELADRLRALRWSAGGVGPGVDGPPLLSEVHHRAEVYAGPLLAGAPDLVAVPAAGVQLRGGWRPPGPGAVEVLTGTHTRGDAVFAAPGGLAASRVDMADVAPTVLAAVGVFPPGLDGSDLRSTTAFRSTTAARAR